ncbi:MAG TPA: radical SAM family heme chaperone HemW [Atribacterota bacterium]|nr:radical SAM family heme chaperone HemW [Atribacterota bacterium]
MDNQQDIGLYLHIPFCLSKCSYCDFFSIVTGNEGLKRRYITALIKEMEIYRQKKKDISLSTIYLGGGTPTILDGIQINEIISSCFSNFQIAGNKKMEITIEANPGTIEIEKSKILLQSGINRLSIGAQSLDNRVLKKIGRVHTKEDFLASYNAAREAGFSNINIDLMFGLPGQSMAGFEKTLTGIIKLKPEHISLYGLSIESGTPLELLIAAGKIKLPSDDLSNDLFVMAIELLKEHNYEHYEISNFALPGKRSIHNQIYWNDKSYLGLGAGATSYLDNKRYHNYQDLEQYIELLNYGILPVEYQEILSMRERMSEKIILKLRMMEGLDKNDFFNQFKTSVEHVFGKELYTLKEQGLLAENKTRYLLTKKGISLANNVFTEFID